jgi:DNA-binding NarL/FixJ family response regulator
VAARKKRVRTGLDYEQRRLLTLIGQGLKLADAASSLDLTTRTAERRLAAARSLLEARTTAQAVALAGVARSSTPRSLQELTRREREVLEGVASGLTSREIAVRLGTRAPTIDALVRSAMSKLDARTRVQAAALAPSARLEVGGIYR